MIKIAIERAVKNNDTRLYNDLEDLQTSLKCCGGFDYHDWTLYNQTLPESCCSIAEPSNVTCTEKDVFHDGCASALKNKFGPYYKVLATVSVTLPVVQLVASVLACFLIGHNKNSYEYIIS